MDAGHTRQALGGGGRGQAHPGPVPTFTKEGAGCGMKRDGPLSVSLSQIPGLRLLVWEEPGSHEAQPARSGPRRTISQLPRGKLRHVRTVPPQLLAGV